VLWLLYAQVEIGADERVWRGDDAAEKGRVAPIQIRPEEERQPYTTGVCRSSQAHKERLAHNNSNFLWHFMPGSCRIISSWPELVEIHQPYRVLEWIRIK